jgi:hypothetical protein
MKTGKIFRSRTGLPFKIKEDREREERGGIHRTGEVGK